MCDEYVCGHIVRHGDQLTFSKKKPKGMKNCVLPTPFNLWNTNKETKKIASSPHIMQTQMYGELCFQLY